MSKNKLAVFFLLPLMLTFCFAASAKTIYKNKQYPSVQNEKFVVRTLRSLHSAQVTFNATTGNGNYGTFSDLQQAELIDSFLASGFKYGYVFQIVVMPGGSGMPAKFYATANPTRYRKTGRKSFYIDESGEMRGADKKGGAATNADPVIDSCFSGNEVCAIGDVRLLHSAQVTYQMTSGSENSATLTQLYTAGLIYGGLASGSRNGYNFTCTIIARTNTTPASFKISAVPVNCGMSGVRSFYMATDGVLRGADKNGASADENDPPIDE